MTAFFGSSIFGDLHYTPGQDTPPGMEQQDCINLLYFCLMLLLLYLYLLDDIIIDYLYAISPVAELIIVIFHHSYYYYSVYFFLDRSLLYSISCH